MDEIYVHNNINHSNVSIVLQNIEWLDENVWWNFNGYIVNSKEKWRWIWMNKWKCEKMRILWWWLILLWIWRSIFDWLSLGWSWQWIWIKLTSFDGLNSLLNSYWPLDKLSWISQENQFQNHSYGYIWIFRLLFY